MVDKMITFVPVNKCFDCDGDLIIVETETDSIMIDENGKILSRDNLFIDTNMICIKCKRKYDVRVKGLRYFKEDNSLEKIVPTRKIVRNPFGYYEVDNKVDKTI